MVEAYLKSVPPAKNCLEQQFVFWGGEVEFLVASRSQRSCEINAIY